MIDEKEMNAVTDNLIKQIKELYMANVMDDINAVIYQVEALQKKVRDLTEERDEARRWFCRAEERSEKTARVWARKRSWDCFKEETQ